MSEDTNKDEHKLTAYERWELPYLKNPTPKKDTGPSILIRENATIVHEEIDETTLVYEPLTASQLDEISLAAYDEGYVGGLEEGYQVGWDKGKEEGFAKGLQEGTDKGVSEGLEKGLEQGIAEAREKLSEVESILEQLRNELEAPINGCKNEVEKVIYKTVARLVENITRTQLNSAAKEALTAQIEYLSRELEDIDSTVRIKIHPDTAELIKAFSVFDRVSIKLERDDSLLPGGFLLDSKGAYLDASIEHKIELILKDLHSIHPHSENDSDGI